MGKLSWYVTGYLDQLSLPSPEWVNRVPASSRGYGGMCLLVSDGRQHCVFHIASDIP